VVNTHKCFKGKPYFKKKVEKCQTLFYKHRTCRRTKCCKFIKFCQGKRCKHLHKACHWRGLKVCYKTKCQCHWNNFGNKCKQKSCCCNRFICHGKKKIAKKIHRKCNSFGKRLCHSKEHRCEWRPYNKIKGTLSRRKFCCKHKTICKNSKCKRLRLNCKWIGSPLVIRIHERCNIQRINSKQEREKCCVYEDRCIKKMCRRITRNCRFTGKPLNIGCSLKIKKVCVNPKIVDTNTLGKQNLCYSQGEPHYYTFSGKEFNNFEKGDFVVVSSQNFVVHARNQFWNSAAVTTNIAVKVGQTKVETISPWFYLLNGKLILLLPKKSFENSDIFIKRINDKTTIIRNKDNDFVRIYYYNAKGKNLPQNQFINTIVRVNNVNNANGLCLGHAEKASGVFESIYDPKQESLVKKEFTKDQIKFARHICRQRLVPRANLRNCQDLYLNTESIEFIKTITDLKKTYYRSKKRNCKKKNSNY